MEGPTSALESGPSAWTRSVPFNDLGGAIARYRFKFKFKTSTAAQQFQDKPKVARYLVSYQKRMCSSIYKLHVVCP